MTRFIGLESETVNVARQKSCDRPQSRDTLKVEPTFNLPLLLGQERNYGLIDKKKVCLTNGSTTAAKISQVKRSKVSPIENGHLPIEEKTRYL